MPRCFFRARFARGRKDGGIFGGSAEFFVTVSRFGMGLMGDFGAKAIAPARRSPSMMSVNDAEFAALRSALMGLPAGTHFDGFGDAGETRKTLRASAPGMMPSFTSGWPTCAVGMATR